MASISSAVMRPETRDPEAAQPPARDICSGHTRVFSLPGARPVRAAGGRTGGEIRDSGGEWTVSIRRRSRLAAAADGCLDGKMSHKLT